MRGVTWNMIVVGLCAGLVACAEEPIPTQEAAGAQEAPALERTQIDDTVRRHLNQVRYCYQRSLVRDPSIAGEIVVKFVVEADGSVSSATAEEATLPDEVVDCILGVFDQMVFPEPTNGGIVISTYPFVFTAG